jgi:hypothetical protein
MYKEIPVIEYWGYYVSAPSFDSNFDFTRLISILWFYPWFFKMNSPFTPDFYYRQLTPNLLIKKEKKMIR